MTTSATPISDDEARAAMRAFLQRGEVRLSTVHRVGQALLGGSALVLLLPLFLRDGFPKLTTLLIASHDAGQSPLLYGGIGLAAFVSILLPVVAIYLLVGDLLGFYFTSNTFGSSDGGRTGPAGPAGRTVFNPRFIVPGLGFNDGDELSPTMGEALADGRRDPWTRALLVPANPDDDGWRDRFDTRTFEVWGTVAAEGPAGDDDRLRQSFRLAGIHRDRTLARDVARTEALLAKHVLSIRIAVLRYTKALLLLIATTVATLGAAGLVEHAIRIDPSGGAFVGGVPDRYLYLVALVYALWAPVAARSVTAPLRMIQRHTPGVGHLDDAYRDRRLTQFESAAVFATLIALVGAVAALLLAGTGLDADLGPWFGIGAAVVAVVLWLLAAGRFLTRPRHLLGAVGQTLQGRDAPAPSAAMRAARDR